MTSVYQNVLSAEELNYLNQLPEVIEAKAKVDARSSGVVYFSVNVTNVIRDTLQTRFGLSLSTNKLSTEGDAIYVRTRAPIKRNAATIHVARILTSVEDKR